MGTQAVPPDGLVDDAIAVIGMACRFAGDATNVENFWEMIRDGRDAWSEIPSDRFNAEGWYHPDPNRPGSFHIRGAHFIKGDIAAFDAPFFSISTAEAISMDPQQRMLLEVVYEALDSAGIPLSSLSNTATSVFCGSFVRDYEQPCMRDPDTTPPYSATGNGIAILANRISHAFDFAGTSQTIDTGCSASMIAVHQACKSLLSGESAVGIAAGVGLIFSPNTLVPMANLNILGSDGRCYTFDKRANGYGRGEGTGVIVLKRLKDAIAANDTIRAVIRATASNQDGHTQGITLPSKERQVQNMSEIYRNAGLDITRTAYMECHGTGTQVGDVKETQAVTEVFCQHRTPGNPLIIGSVKTNIGHLEGSAGIAGLIKGILVVERGFIPKHLNFTSPNPEIDFESMRLKIATGLTPWPVPGLRRASVNSFGFGGTNAHVVLDDAPHFLSERQITSAHHNTYLFPSDELQVQESICSQTPCNHLFVFSGHDEPGLARVTKTQAEYLAKHTSVSEFEADYAYTLLSRRSRLSWRTFVVAASAAELLQKLHEKRISKPLRAARCTPPRLAYIFSGQGAQWYAMGRELLTYQVFYASVSTASWYMSSVLGSTFHLWDELHRSKELSHIDEPQIAQPATTAIQIALVDLLVSAGLEPDSVVGHSSGEIAAAYAAGAIRREDAWKIAYYRGQCVSRIATLAPHIKGGMLAVSLSEEDARHGIAEAGVDSVDVACINGPTSVTLSGDVDGISRLCNFFRDMGSRAMRVNVSTAYHSRHMEVIEDDYREVLGILTPILAESKTTFFSSVFGRAISFPELGAEYWVKNLLLPVQFYRASTAMMGETRPEVFLEVSPHRVWESTLHQIYNAFATEKTKGGVAQPTYLSLLCRDKDASTTALNAMGDLWVWGLSVNPNWALTSCGGRKPRHLVDVPSYPWDHSKTYWHESHLSKANRFRSHGREDIIGAPLENSTPQGPRWRGFFRVQENPWLEDHVIQKSIMYPAGGMVAMAVEAAKQLADHNRKILGYEISDLRISKPMLIPTSSEGLENMLSAQLIERNEESRTKTECVYRFSILSKPTDAPWATHASGRFAVVYCEEDASIEAEMEKKCGTVAQREAYRYVQKVCHTRLDPRQFYETLDVIGMTYGPQFRNLVEIEKGDTSALAVIKIPDTKTHMPFHFEFDHVIHPATLDTMLQTVVAVSDGCEAMLPCSADRIFVSANLPKGAGSHFRGYTSARKTTSRSARADIAMFDDELQEPAVVIENLLFKSAPSQTGAGSGRFLPSHRNLCSEIVWKKDASSIAALGFGFPTNIPEIVDLAAHKNPALSILYHMPDSLILDHENNDVKQLRIVAETLKITNFVFDNLTAGYETPRFSHCTVSGVDSDKVLQHMRMLKGAHPGFERVQHSGVVPENSSVGLALCSIDEQTSEDSISEICKHITEDGCLVLLSKLGEPIVREQYESLRRTIQTSGFRVDKEPTKTCTFLAARKIAKGTRLENTPKTRHDRVIILLPDTMSTFVSALKDTLRLVFEKQLSTEVHDIQLSSVLDMSEEEIHAPMLSLVEVDSPMIFAMKPQTFLTLHRLLTQSRGLLWLSQGAQFDCKSPDRSPFTGLARTLRSEGSKKQIMSLDLDINLIASSNNGVPTVPENLVKSIAYLFKRVFANNAPADSFEDVEFAYSEGCLLIPRLMPLTVLNRAIEKGPSEPQMVDQTPLLARGRAMKLDVSSLGAISGPRFVEDTEALHRPLLANEIRIAVTSTNMLPEDIVPASRGTPPPMLGTDVFGSVLEVGSGVVSLRPGHCVVARMRDTIKTHVIVDQAKARRVEYSGKWRGSCPTAFATAMYALKTGRRIMKGDFVLVYGVSLAYGQAAIRLALTLGGHVLVACSTAGEKHMMREHFKIPSCHILDMRDTSDKFEAQVLSLTQQCGVDVVFDPTSRHIEQGFRCVAECGRVIRVAQKGCDASSFQLLDKNVSFETVDIDLLESRRPAEAQRLSADVDKILQLAPGLDTVCGALEYSMCDLQGALKHAAAILYASPHILYTEAVIGQNMVSTPIQLTRKVDLSPSVTYLLIGGLGGLGRSIAEHLARNGARHIAFFSRSGAVAGPAQDLLARLHASGVHARAFAVDICDEEQLAASIKQVHSVMPPIRGAIQCAAVVDDAAFSSMDYERWRKAFEPKTTGSNNLHQQLPRDMDFFIFLSSSSGVIGNRGQANYSAGNSFQDALARYRSGLGMHSVSVDLGLVLGAGMVAENEGLLDAMRASGFIGIRLQDALLVLDQAMARPGSGTGINVPAQIVTAVGTGGLTIQNRPSDPFWTHTALFRYLNQVDAPPQGLNTTGGGDSGHQNLRTAIQGAATIEDASRAVCVALIATVARRKCMVPGDFDQHQSFGSYGIDSLDSIFVLGWIARETGVTVQTVEGATIAELSRDIARRTLEAVE